MFDFDSIDVESFLPHQRPMVLIDKIIDSQADQLTAQVTITPQSPYFDEQRQGVPNYVGIEYMAQTIAALAGVEAKRQQAPIKVGFLLGSRKLVFQTPTFKLNQSYQITVLRLYQEESGLAVFDCKIELENQIVASANVNVYQPQDTQTYLQQGMASDNGE